MICSAPPPTANRVGHGHVGGASSPRYSWGRHCSQRALRSPPGRCPRRALSGGWSTRRFRPFSNPYPPQRRRPHADVRAQKRPGSRAEPHQSDRAPYLGVAVRPQHVRQLPLPASSASSAHRRPGRRCHGSLPDLESSPQWCRSTAAAKTTDDQSASRRESIARQ